MAHRGKLALKGAGIAAVAAAAGWGWWVVANLVFWLYLFHAKTTFSFGMLYAYAHAYWGDPRVMPALKIAAAVPTLILGALAFVEIGRRFKAPKQSLYGETRFATDKEIAEKGFRSPPDEPAIYIGRRDV